MKYDPVSCITAGELRDAGVEVSAEIPDCGWITRIGYLRALRDAKVTAKATNERERYFAMLTTIQLPPFHWVEINGTIEI